jgi:hypothetical protein
LKLQLRPVQEEVKDATGGVLGVVLRLMLNVSVREPPAARRNEACNESSVAITFSAPQVGLAFSPEVTSK